MKNPEPLIRHLSVLLEVLRWRLSVPQFLLSSFVVACTGMWTGAFLFASLKGAVLCGVAGGSVLYLAARVRLLNRQMKSRLEFLPAVEVFYQHYVLSEGKNLRNTLKEAVLEGRIRHPILPVFEQLHRNLTTSRDVEQCTELFAASLGHLWAKYFANMILVALKEGNHIAENIQELIQDMRRAQLSAQAERNRMLEIRLASFSPLLFLSVFLFVNFRIDYDQAYRYYVLDAAGRNMLLDALMLIFASFIMGLFLTHRKI